MKKAENINPIAKMENWFEFAMVSDEGLFQLLKHFYKKVIKEKLKKFKVVTQYLPDTSRPIVNNNYQIFGQIVCEADVKSDFFRDLHKNPSNWD